MWVKEGSYGAGGKRRGVLKRCQVDWSRTQRVRAKDGRRRATLEEDVEDNSLTIALGHLRRPYSIMSNGNIASSGSSFPLETRRE